jgi:hypothetical protein
MDGFTSRLHVRTRSQPAVGQAASFLQSRWKNLYSDIKKDEKFFFETPAGSYPK